MEQTNQGEHVIGDSTDDHESGVWVLALTRPGEGFLGRVHGLGGDSDATFTRRDVLLAELITLYPVYDYRERVKEIPVTRDGKVLQDPNIAGIPLMQPMRTPLIMPVGFTLEGGPVHVPGLCYGTTLRFLDEMDARDARTYRNFAKEARSQMRDARLQASNLTAPSADDIARIGRR